jgi:outer membrane receptor for ferrienterochelin and colicin
MSLLYDQYRELFTSLPFSRREVVPGAFAEYSYQWPDKFSLVAGLRADWHNLFGWFATPRLHARYAPDSKTVLRASIGRGQRTANVFAEYSGVMASSRIFEVPGGTAYGLRPEVAWNTGLTLSRDFRLDYRPGQVAAEYYYTWFTQQVVADLDASPQAIRFYNLEGPSFAHSLQVSASYEAVRRLNLRAAWKYQQAQVAYAAGLRERPFLPRQRAFFNAEYKTRSGWHADLTWQWTGSQRLPDTYANPEAHQRLAQTPGFMTVHGQLSKRFERLGLDLYAGIENALDYVQPDPIVAAADPYGPYFDASLIWAPIFGRMWYAGFRWSLRRAE